MLATAPMSTANGSMLEETRHYAPLDADKGKLDDVPDTHWRFLTEELLPYYETDSHFFVHANAYPDIPLAEQPDFMLYWEQLNDPPQHESGKTMICGHTSQKSGLPITNGHAICIDTWACGQGWLSCLDVASGKIWQARQSGERRELWLDELPQTG
jgi:serine/threonine protein phosphatase 1